MTVSILSYSQGTRCYDRSQREYIAEKIIENGLLHRSIELKDSLISVSKTEIDALRTKISFKDGIIITDSLLLVNCDREKIIAEKKTKKVAIIGTLSISLLLIMYFVK
jgi:hypothetical protein